MGRKTKRQLVRDERRQKKRDRDVAVEEEARETKRQRREATEADVVGDADFIPFDNGEAHGDRGHGAAPEREFFGLLADDEQEYFRRADELLELNDFPSTEARDTFLENVYKEAKGKELKLASSQSCSRLMERLILLSTAKQKKSLFQAFTGHFTSLVTHRFASHCCEKLFLQSAPVVTEELGGVEPATGSNVNDEEQAPEESMEDLFLLMLDELEDHLTFLISDRFASHTIRVLLVVLSGRPLDQVSTKSLLQSKKKEHITVYGVSTSTSESTQLRAVPESFSMAIHKIIADSTSSMDATALRVLATHPTGNPVLQLLLELDIALNSQASGSEKKGQESTDTSLLHRLLPGAPASLSDAESEASGFVNSMLYDSIGSRLLETLITNCPGKVFKGLYQNILGPRIGTFLRNDTASYPAIKALNRLSKEDLVDAVQKTLPQVSHLISKGRFNVLKVLFERCNVRHANDEIRALLKAICEAYESDDKCLVPKLCGLEEEEEAAEQKEEFQHVTKNKSASVSHGSQLAAIMLSIPHPTSKAIQTSLLALGPERLLRLATTSTATANVLLTALSTPAKNNQIFHKALVASLITQLADLTSSQYGHNVVNAIVSMPSRGDGVALPFHLKQAVMTQLGEQEPVLRESWMGRSVWRTWKGDLWRHRRSDWIKWIKDFDPAPTEQDRQSKPWMKVGPADKGKQKDFGGGAGSGKGRRGPQIST